MQRVQGLGFVLHPIDLAVNKVLALAGRDEARDILDVMSAHETLLPLGALCWAACGKYPGLNPDSLLELLKRRGKYRPEDFNKLNLNVKIEVQELKQKWLKALEGAETFTRKAPPDQVGCLYFSTSQGRFIEPDMAGADLGADVQIHRGRPGGVIPLIK